MTVINLDNRDIHTLFSNLSTKLLKVHKKFPAIFNADGSDTLCSFLSYCLNIPIIDLEQTKQTKFIWVTNVMNYGNKLKEFKKCTNLEQGKDFVVATLHYNDKSKNKPNFYVKIKSENQWVVFP